jgi:acyl carrier protein
MKKEEIKIKVIALLHQQGVSTGEHIFTDDLHLVDDLGLDSLDTIELVMEVEKEFGIKVPDDKVYDFKTFGDLLNAIVLLKAA